MVAIITDPHIDEYRLVPKDPFENSFFRLKVRERADVDSGYRRALRTICGEDFLFFCNVFGWLHEPRKRFTADGKLMPKKIPFITRPHQDPVFLEVRKNLGLNDVVVKKSRDEGASWMGIWLALQDWCFGEMVSIGIVSKNEEAVYKPNYSGSIFWKLDYGVSMVPAWIHGNKWHRNYNDNTLANLLRGNTIAGYAATGTAATGDRTDWFMFDEIGKFPRPKDQELLESLSSVTDGILAISTPFGSTGAYYDMVHNPSTVTTQVTLHWAQNPAKNRGLYRMIRGIPEAVDPKENPLPPEYNPPTPEILKMFDQLRQRGFRLEEGVRSPWYDKQCNRPQSKPASIAQELDINFGGSVTKWFGEEFRKAGERTTVPPLMTGELRYNEELEPQFSKITDGRLKLWLSLDASSCPPKGNYAIGGDIGSGSSGSFTSNSTLIVVNLDTQEQVATFASNSIFQSEFADFSISLAKWFWNAKLGWEYNYASAYTERIVEQKYYNVWERPVIGKKRKRRKRGRGQGPDLGWWTDGRKTKPLMFNDIDFFVRNARLIVRDQIIITEAKSYINNIKGIPEFEGQEGNAAHGDHVIAFGCCVEMAKEHFKTHGFKKKKEKTPEQERLEAIEKMFADEDRRSRPDNNGWDETTPADLLGEGVSPGNQYAYY